MISNILNKKISLSWYLFIAVCSFYMTALNYLYFKEFFRILNSSDNDNILLKLLSPLSLFAVCALFLTIFSSKYLLKPVASLLLFLTGLSAYCQYAFDAVFMNRTIKGFVEDYPTFADKLQFVTLGSVTFVLIFGLLPAVLVWFTDIRWSKKLLKGLLHRLGAAGLCILLALVSIAPFYRTYVTTMRSNRSLRSEIIPFSLIFGTQNYIESTYFSDLGPFKVLGEDAALKPDTKPTLFVFMIGETARAANFPYNGYERNTTPYTDKLVNSIFLKNVRSCGTATAQSLPCMFSLKTQKDIDLDTAGNESNLIDVLTKAGYAGEWYDNDSNSCKGVCKRMKIVKLNAEREDFDAKYKCNEEGCFDSLLVDQLKEALNERPSDHRIIFLHLIGSHGPTYYHRVPDEFKKFSPYCETAKLSECTQEQIINAYDNTLIYTDYIVAEVKKVLDSYSDRYDTGLLYVSDHGESLGENGIYLHGAPYYIAPDVQTHVPMQFWLSDRLIDNRKLDMKCMRTQEQKTEGFSHDNIVHSLMGILNVHSKVYDQDLDIFAPCYTDKN